MGNSKYTFGKLYFSMEEYAIHTLSIQHFGLLKTKSEILRKFMDPQHKILQTSISPEEEYYVWNIASILNIFDLNSRFRFQRKKRFLNEPNVSMAAIGVIFHGRLSHNFLYRAEPDSKIGSSRTTLQKTPKGTCFFRNPTKSKNTFFHFV